MKQFGCFEALGRLFAALLVIFIGIILGTFIGALTGWIVGWFFGDTILSIFAYIGIKGFSMWQIGAFLGFVSGFFRSVNFNLKF